MTHNRNPGTVSVRYNTIEPLFHNQFHQCIDVILERMDKYITLVPKGLEDVAIEMLETKIISIQKEVRIIHEVNSIIKKNECILSNIQNSSSSGTMYIHGFGDVRYGRLKEKVILSNSGLWEGQVWIIFETNAPPEFIALQLPFLGPILSYIHHFSTSITKSCDITQLQDTLDLFQQHPIPTSHHDDDDSNDQFDQALDLWKRHVIQVWKQYTFPDPSLYTSLVEKLTTNNTHIGLTYRISCVRSSCCGRNSQQTKHQESKPRYQYTREELNTSIASTSIITVPKQEQWKVKLSNHDLEQTIFLVPTMEDQFQCVIGFTLRPYSYLNIKAFGKHRIPAEPTPYTTSLSGEGQDDIVRLRPTNCHLLLHFAKLQVGDIICDPCAGFNSIPNTTSSCNHPSVVAFGGDIVASKLLSSNNNTRHNDVVNWDASWLPIRSSSIDVIISDLPFGVKCMNKRKLMTWLPLFFIQCFRIIRSNNNGRMVLLCGGTYNLLLDTINEYFESYIQQPIAIRPVNIGGINAWILILYRNSKPMEKDILPTLNKRIKTWTAGRDHRQKSIHHSIQKENGGKKRKHRLQS